MGILVNFFVFIGLEILFWISLFLFWMILLPLLCVFLTPVFLIAAAFSGNSYGMALGSRYKRLVDLWTDWSTVFP